MNEKNTHLLFDGQKIVISPNLHRIFDFLSKIDLEIQTLLDSQKRLTEINEQVMELLELTGVMSKLIQDNNLDFDFTFKKDPFLLAEKFKQPQLTRVEMIAIFASIETIICLYTAYENETDSDDEIRKFLSDPKYIRKVINKLFLCGDNEYYSRNRIRFAKVSAKQIRLLRNRLTHFFSVEGLNIVPDVLSSKAREIEKALSGKVSLISPYDLVQLEKGATAIILNKWNKDSQTLPEQFERKIKYVNSVVENQGAIFVEGNKISFK